MANCQKNTACAGSFKKRNYTWIPAILVAILPKCPFCVMAYTGAVSMCSGNMLYPNANSTSSYIMLAIALLVLLSIAFNFNGKKTWIALLIATLGIALMLIGQFYFISMTNYYLGVLLLFFGIWYNGSFFHFYKKYITT